MTALGKSPFVAKWKAKFADNVSRIITEEFLREFTEDLSDSFINTVDFSAPSASFSTISGNALDNVSLQQTFSEFLSTVRGGVSTDYNNLKKLYDFVVQQIDAIEGGDIDGGTPAEQLDFIKLRGGTLAEWTAANPVLGAKEPGVVTDYGRVVIGDGNLDFLELWANLLETGGTGSGSLLYFINEAALIVAKPPDSPDREAGEAVLVQGVNYPTVWTWDPISEAWEDTGTEVNFTVDQELVPGSTNPVASFRIQNEFAKYLLLNGSINMDQVVGLITELAVKLEASDMYNILSPLLQNGSGINIQKNGTTFQFFATGIGGTGAGDFYDIGGLPLDNIALRDEFLKYQKKPVWKASTLVGTTRTFDLSGNDIYEFTANPSADETWVISNIPATYTTQVVRIPIHITYQTSDFTATLPANSEVNGDPQATYAPENIGVGIKDFVLATVYPDGKIEWAWDQVDGEGGNGGVYDLEPIVTHPNADGIPNGANLTGLTWQQIVQWAWCGIAPVAGTGIGSMIIESTFIVG